MPFRSNSRPITGHCAQVSDPFWSEKMDLVRHEVIPYQYLALNDLVEGADKSYCVENFQKAARIADAIRAESWKQLLTGNGIANWATSLLPIFIASSRGRRSWKQKIFMMRK